MRHRLMLTFLLFGIAIAVGCEQVAIVDGPSSDDIETTVDVKVEATLSSAEQVPAVATSTSETEALVVQAAMDLYMADTGAAPAAQAVATSDMTASTPALSPEYIRTSTTKCTYTWTATTGVVTQVACPPENEVDLAFAIEAHIETQTVQAAMDLYMEDTGAAPAAQAVATSDMTASNPALSPGYIRIATTKCTYTWAATTGVVMQVACPQ